jgi:hypothetical protein
VKQILIAEKLDITAKHLCDVKHGRKAWTIPLAKEIEKKLGVSKLKCLFPDEYGTPWPELLALPDDFELSN